MTKVKLIDLVEKDSEGNTIKYKIMPYESKWIDLKLEADWVQHGEVYNKPQYKKEGNKVYLRGLVRNPNSTERVIANLPEEIIPKKTCVIPKKADTQGAVTQGTIIYIGNQNQLRVDRGYIQDTPIFLDGIIYFID